MLREILYRLFQITLVPELTWRDAVIATVGAVLLLCLIPLLRAIFFNLKRNAQIAMLSSRVLGATLAAGWVGMSLDIFGYALTLVILLPLVFLVMMVVFLYVLFAR